MTPLVCLRHIEQWQTHDFLIQLQKLFHRIDTDHYFPQEVYIFRVIKYSAQLQVYKL